MSEQFDHDFPYQPDMHPNASTSMMDVTMGRRGFGRLLLRGAGYVAATAVVAEVTTACSPYIGDGAEDPWGPQHAREREDALAGEDIPETTQGERDANAQRVKSHVAPYSMDALRSIEGRRASNVAIAMNSPYQTPDNVSVVGKKLTWDRNILTLTDQRPLPQPASETNPNKANRFALFQVSYLVPDFTQNYRRVESVLADPSTRLLSVLSYSPEGRQGNVQIFREGATINGNIEQVAVFAGYPGANTLGEQVDNALTVIDRVADYYGYNS